MVKIDNRGYYPFQRNDNYQTQFFKDNIKMNSDFFANFLAEIRSKRQKILEDFYAAYLAHLHDEVDLKKICLVEKHDDLNWSWHFEIREEEPVIISPPQD